MISKFYDATPEELGEGRKLDNPLTQAALEYISEANYQIQIKQYKKAYELFNQSILICPLAVGYSGMADLCVILRKYNAAYQNYQHAIKQNYSYAVEKLIKFLLRQYNLKEAETLFFHYFVQFPQLTIEYRQIWFYTQNFQELIENQQIHEDAEEQVNNTLHLIDLLFLSGHCVEAFSMCYKMISSLSLQYYGHYIYKAAEFLYLLKRFEEAILLLNFLISSNQSIIKNYKLLAKIFVYQGKFCQARALINDLIKLYPYDSSTFEFLMWLYSYTNKVQLGIQQFDQEIETCPQLIDVHLNKCYGLYHMEIYPQLLEYLEQMESQFGQHHKIVKYKAKCFLALKQYDKCIEQCELIQILKPTSAKGYYIKCILHLNKLELTKFILSYEQGIKLKPVSYKFRWLKQRYHQIMNQPKFLFASLEEENYLNKDFNQFSYATFGYSTHLSYQMELQFRINQLQSFMSTQNYLQLFPYYLLKYFQMLQSFDLDETLEFNQYFTILLWTVDVYILSIHFNPSFRLQLLRQFDHFQLEYQDPTILCDLFATEFQLNQVNTRYVNYDLAYKWTFQLGVGCNYHFKNLKKEKHKLSLIQERLSTYYSIYQSEQGEQALIDSFKILQGIKEKKIDVFLSEDFIIQIIDVLQQQ